ncbi:MAG: hypothetical protein L5656_05740 [Thermanaeromonas sp.]|uniref:capping complex subunit for YIEGIA n=1 Tax=Thermanaeromonas sp. TaxID=2003697 RepID=UPI00243AC001|nr:hypothetical protein [Thermanaeromonas sp.]MCG0278015.1 hypothetical protein [Thermanaeromonas sp.]
MAVELKGEILAVVATRDSSNKVGGGLPIFLAEDEEERQKLGLILSRALNAVAHDLENGVLIIVRH